MSRTALHNNSLLTKSLLYELNYTKTNTHYHMLKADLSSKIPISWLFMKSKMNKSSSNQI